MLCAQTSYLFSLFQMKWIYFRLYTLFYSRDRPRCAAHLRPPETVPDDQAVEHGGPGLCGHAGQVLGHGPQHPPADQLQLPRQVQLLVAKRSDGKCCYEGRPSLTMTSSARTARPVPGAPSTAAWACPWPRRGRRWSWGRQALTHGRGQLALSSEFRSSSPQSMIMKFFPS